MMKEYQKTNPKIWTGRSSDQSLYLHEKVECIDFEHGEIVERGERTLAILGYACDEGVKRNHGRIGAVDGPDTIRKALAKMPNHLAEKTRLLDVGSVRCSDRDMEATQTELADMVFQLLEKKVFPILLGGGHDIAYGHYKGIGNHLGQGKCIGILNFDAHFDLRSNENGNNSGTPFYQIANDCEAEGIDFKYLCLGIRRDANDKVLFSTAKEIGARYIENERFHLSQLAHIKQEILRFVGEVDYVYATIDLDGFSSAYAPGVSAPSPMGFSPDIVLECLKLIIDSKKLISIDLAEMNPAYDIDHQTAKLAASLIHFVMHRIS